MHVISPETFIGLSVLVNINSKAIGSILVEFSRVYVAIGMVEIALTLGHAIPPVSLVFGAILPYLGALAVLDVHFLIIFIFHFFHLTGVCSAFAYFEICLVNYFFFVDFFYLMTER